MTYEVIDIDLEAIQTTKEVVAGMELPKRIKTLFTHSDILLYKYPKINEYDFVYIFGSLPYNVSKKIVNACKQISLELFPTTTLLPSRFVIQKEVADDYISLPPNAAFIGTDLSLTLIIVKLLAIYLLVHFTHHQKLIVQLSK